MKKIDKLKNVIDESILKHIDNLCKNNDLTSLENMLKACNDEVKRIKNMQNIEVELKFKLKCEFEYLTYLVKIGQKNMRKLNESYFQAVIFDNSYFKNSEGKIIHLIKNSCSHKHKSISSAYNCLKKLSKYYKDNSCNHWSRFGEVAHSNGLRLLHSELEALESIKCDSFLK